MAGPKAPKFLPPAAIGAEIDRTGYAANAARAAAHVRQNSCNVCSDKPYCSRHANAVWCVSDANCLQDAAEELEKLRDAQAAAQAVLLEKELLLQDLKGNAAFLVAQRSRCA